jgi:two-component system response regulator NreC
MRLALVDDHELFRAGLAALLSRYPEFEVVGQAENAREAYLVIEHTRPDAVLLDLRLPGTDGIAAAREIRRRHPEIRIAMLSAFADPDFVSDALQAGAHAYLLKADPFSHCIEGLRAVARGQIYLAPGISPAAIEQHQRLSRSPERQNAFNLLSKREKEVFHLLLAGQSNTKISKELCISVKTVESHREHILKKLGVHSIVELVRFAARNGLILD